MVDKKEYAAISFILHIYKPFVHLCCMCMFNHNSENSVAASAKALEDSTTPSQELPSALKSSTGAALNISNFGPDQKRKVDTEKVEASAVVAVRNAVIIAASSPKVRPRDHKISAESGEKKSANDLPQQQLLFAKSGGKKSPNARPEDHKISAKSGGKKLSLVRTLAIMKMKRTDNRPIEICAGRDTCSHTKICYRLPASQIQTDPEHTPNTHRHNHRNRHKGHFEHRRAD